MRLFTLLAAIGIAATASAQTKLVAPVPPAPSDRIEVPKADSPDDPVVQAYAASQKRRSELERELRRIRMSYFSGIRNTEVRQVGIAKLREYTDPAIFPSLLKIFERDGSDVRTAILDHLQDQRSPLADATLAWAAMFDSGRAHREAAARRLLERARETGEVSLYVRSAIAKGLRSGVHDEVSAAAQLANTLNLVDAIPLLINAQIQGAQIGQGGGGGETSLAYILVGQQQTFVADLTPVVADSAVAFDPTLGVVTDGVILRIIDAVVLTYRVEVNNALIGLSSRAWGQPTRRLGWDNRGWVDWYVKEFRPYWEALPPERRAAILHAGPEANPGLAGPG